MTSLGVPYPSTITTSQAYLLYLDRYRCFPESINDNNIYGLILLFINEI